MASSKTRSTKGSGRRTARSAIAGQASYDYALLGIVAVLVGLGLVMIFSASYAYARELYDQSTYFFLNQLRWLVLGTVVLVAAANLDYRMWQPLAVAAMAVTVLLLVAVLIFGEKNLGARRHLFNGSLQPSELAKITITFYIAYWLTSKGERLREISYGLLPFAVLLGLVAGLLLLEPDVGTTVLLVLTAWAMFFIAGADPKQLVISLSASAFTLFLMVTRLDYASNRLQQFLVAWNDPAAGSYHIREGVRAFANGGLIGTGLGSGPSKLPGGLPLPWSDSIFAVVGEELGLVGSLAVVALFMALAYRGLRITLQAQDPFGMVLACGTTAWMTLQAFINMAVNTATLPFSGMPLPFISYGGSSLVISLAGIGVLLSISRYGKERLPAAKRSTSGQASSAGSGGWDWRSRIPDLGSARRPARAVRRSSSPGRRSAGQANRRPSGYTAKASSVRRPRGLSRQLARTRRQLARRANSSRSRSASSSTGRRIPRRR